MEQRKLKKIKKKDDIINISAKINIRKDIFKNQFNNEEDKEEKYQTIITHESMIEQGNENENIDNNKIPDFMNYMEKDEFIFDDLKYLELIAKDHINNTNKKKEKIKIMIMIMIYLLIIKKKKIKIIIMIMMI